MSTSDLGKSPVESLNKVEGEPEITKDIDYIMFLYKSALRENAGWLLNTAQSLYKVEGDNLLGFPSNKLELNFEDLLRLSENE